MALDPLNGETPLTVAPTWGGSGGGQQAAAVYAWNAFQKQFGRNPTQSELTMLTPAYMGANPNVANNAGGDAEVAKYFNAQQSLQSQNPITLAQKQRDQLSQQAPQYYDQIKQQFQSVLGRDPSQAELDHFAPMFASGNADAYSIGQALQALPEYTQKQDATAQADLTKNLQQADTDYFTKNIQPAITSQFAQSGRMVDSNSAPLAAAFANAASQQNSAREQYLAQIQYGNYANNRQTLMNNYLANQGQQFNADQYNRAQTAALSQAAADQTNQITDYGIQQSAYQQYLSQMGRRQGSNGLGGALSGAFSGAAMGSSAGPWGALAGAALGGTGGYFSSKNMYSSY